MDLGNGCRSATARGHRVSRRRNAKSAGSGTAGSPFHRHAVGVRIRSGCRNHRRVAPGQLADDTLAALCVAGVNRVSLGVQSFIDTEAKSSGRFHSRAIVAEDLRRLRAAGIANLNVDLIAGLAGQTLAYWQESLDVLIGSGVPHASVYMLEVDEDSRLGREMLAGGARYHAELVPSDDTIARMYGKAIEQLAKAGLFQYEISNFSQPISALGVTISATGSGGRTWAWVSTPPRCCAPHQMKPDLGTCFAPQRQTTWLRFFPVRSCPKPPGSLRPASMRRLGSSASVSTKVWTWPRSKVSLAGPTVALARPSSAFAARGRPAFH